MKEDTHKSQMPEHEDVEGGRQTRTQQLMGDLEELQPGCTDPNGTSGEGERRVEPL